MTILDKIITEKKKEVAHLLNQTFDQVAIDKKVKPFQQIVNDKSTMSVIAEIKRASPSKGMINQNVDPIHQAKIYAENGASAISVLTDTPFFKGSMEDLRAIREIVDIPILCKDFIIDKIQIDRAKAAGANIILLIAAALTDADLKKLYEYSIENELEVLCEVHNKEEMERILNLNAKIIGINNRDLKTFHVDLDTTTRLASMVTDPETILISESGIQTKEDVETVAKARAKSILVGETLMRANNVAETIQHLQIPLSTNKARI
ncbi:indole-3-glycerol phosphate synthase TrpC [Pseudogracilibacillus sp. SO30301A]|uniref:indole-3-glycerol phosphate synthase TrpC n=1 Tax=Pseudogracilibacillus sp. SO30301A TaxID=3098291 RepID=UPI00300E2AD8